MNNEEYTKDIYLVSTDKSKLDIDAIHAFLTQSYWSPGIPKSSVEKAISNSLCFGVYDGKKQIGFARIISDFASFAYLADVFVIESYRGKGLSKFLMECIMKHAQLQGLRRILLATRDAHELYRKFGFTPLDKPERFMHVHKPNVY